jgi:hypothetical protein
MSESTQPRAASPEWMTCWPPFASSAGVAKRAWMAGSRLGTIRNPNATAVPKHTQG